MVTTTFIPIFFSSHFFKRLVLCAYMWTNSQTKRNKRFRYGKWRLHTSLTPLYGSVMASQPLTAFVGFPHFHWNCETDRCLPAFTLSHTSFYVLLSPSRSFCPSVLPSNYFSLFRLSLFLSGEGEIFDGLHIV